jgi:hypothetical protein
MTAAGVVRTLAGLADKDGLWQGGSGMKELAAALALLALVWSTHAQFTAGTVASYAGQSFTTGGVTYSFPTNDYTFAGIGVAPIPASAVNLRPDPNGANTILISCTNWNLTQPNVSLDMDIYFQVTGADIQGGWQHSAVVTGDGSVSESTIVQTTPRAVSTSFQTAAGGVDLPPAVWFADSPQDAVVHISLSSGQNGTASLRSYGTHFGLQFPSLSIAPKKPNSVQLGFVVPAGQACTLHASTNLFDWAALATVTNPGSTGILTNYPDPIGSAPSRRFYRVSLP